MENPWHKAFLSTTSAVAIALWLSTVRVTFALEYYTRPREITGVEAPIPSPDGRFAIFYRKRETKGLFNDVYPEHQIWIRSITDPGRPVLLCTYGRDANVSWSPDSKMVAITDFADSSDSYVAILRISPPLVVEAVPEVIPFIDAHEKQMLPAYDHFYAEVVGWSEDSEALVIELRGDFTEWNFTQTEYTTHHIQKQVIFKIPEKK